MGDETGVGVDVAVAEAVCVAEIDAVVVAEEDHDCALASALSVASSRRYSVEGIYRRVGGGLAIVRPRDSLMCERWWCGANNVIKGISR